MTGQTKQPYLLTYRRNAGPEQINACVTARSIWPTLLAESADTVIKAQTW